MKILPHNINRCSGVIRFSASRDDEWPVHDMCVDRETCQRYLAFTKWDAASGLESYLGIPVTMAVGSCENKIEVEV